MVKGTSKPMTYGRLGEVLTDLDFVKKDGEDFVAYYNTGYQAMVVLPVTSPDEVISIWHLLAVRKVLTEKRVASVEALEQRLKRRLRRPSNPVDAVGTSTPASTANKPAITALSGGPRKRIKKKQTSEDMLA